MRKRTRLSPDEVDARAARLRTALSGATDVVEKRMFGGICFMLRDHMLCGTGKPGFMFRVGLEGETEALSRPGAERMAFNGRAYAGFVWVDPEACDARKLVAWVALARRFVDRLPPKTKKAPRKRQVRHP